MVRVAKKTTLGRLEKLLGPQGVVWNDLIVPFAGPALLVAAARK